MKKCVIILSLALLFSLLTGCSITEMNIEGLMSPPKGVGEDASIKTTLEESVGSYTLKYPQNGEYRSAIILKNIDGDLDEEAIAFYQKGNDTSRTYMSILKKDNNGKWAIINEFSNVFKTVDEVCFCRIDQDGNIAVAVGYQGGNFTSNKLFLINYSQTQEAFEVENFSYSKFCCNDFDDDNIDEVLLFPLAEEDSDLRATMLKYGKSTSHFDNIGQVNMNSSIVEYNNLLFGTVFQNQVGVAVDSTLNSQQYCTDIIYWDKQAKALRTLLYDDTTKKSLSKRYTQEVCEDINGDGTIEIPVSVPMQGYKLPDTTYTNIYTLSRERIIFLTKWSTYNITSNMLETVRCDIINNDFRYRLTIPASWETKVTGVFDYSTNTFTLSYYKPDNTTKADPILKIKMFTLYGWENQSDADLEYTELERNNKYVYSAFIPENKGDCVMTYEYLEENFALL